VPEPQNSAGPAECGDSSKIRSPNHVLIRDSTQTHTTDTPGHPACPHRFAGSGRTDRGQSSLWASRNRDLNRALAVNATVRRPRTPTEPSHMHVLPSHEHLKRKLPKPSPLAHGTQCVCAEAPVISVKPGTQAKKGTCLMEAWHSIKSRRPTQPLTGRDPLPERVASRP